jgi:flavin-dependent dehydrogenase
MLQMKNIKIVGGGTAGLLCALILKRRFDKMDIEVIKSDKIGIIGVGESSTEHWSHFNDFLKLSEQEVILKTDATYKASVYFDGWTNKPYFHSLDETMNNFNIAQYKAAFGYLLSQGYENKDYINPHFIQNQLETSFVPSQLQFNTLKLNDYLLELCERFKIKVTEDLIKDVILNEDGSIKKLIGRIEYIADFYVDCTGFKRLLIGKMGAKWRSYSKYLHVNQAIAFPTKDTEEYPPFTISKAMKSGWLWRIPTWGRWGNGYAFNNNFINVDQAKQEVEEFLGHSIEIFKNIKFDSGSIDRPWIKNCMAVGLASSFLEPLEATAIATAIQQSFLLMHYLPNYTQQSIDRYNDKITYLLQNMVDFVFLSYMVDKKDTPFWKYTSELTPPETLSYNLSYWKNRLPIHEDFIHNRYILFREGHYIIKMHALNLFNMENIKYEFDMQHELLKKYIKSEVENFFVARKNIFRYNHKTLIKKIREGDPNLAWPLK